MRKKEKVLDLEFWETMDGRRLSHFIKNGSKQSLPQGCMKGCVSENDLNVLRGLCRTLARTSGNKRLISWGDGLVDTKKKCFATIKQSQYKTVCEVVATNILLHDAHGLPTDSVQEQRKRSLKHVQAMQSFVQLDLKADEICALGNIITDVRTWTRSYVRSGQLKQYEADSVQLHNLAAIQPNLHCGSDFLPLHLDNPRHDGFGIVIITVALWGSADIVIVDEGDPTPGVAPTNLPAEEQSQASLESILEAQSWAFTLSPGEFYVLSGHARNKCAHGVCVTANQTPVECHLKPPTPGRSTLTLRFGIHSSSQAEEDIDKHWRG